MGECGSGALPLEIYVADVVLNTNTNLTNTPGWAGPHERAPAWSPDGTQIAFAASTQSCSGTTTLLSRRPIFRMPAAGGAATRVSDPQPRTFIGTDEITVVTLDTEDDNPDWQPCVPATTSACISIAAPRNTVPPAITGTPRVGSTLTCEPGTWTGSTGLAYRWLRSGTEIPGATAPTYVVRAEDVYHSLTCEVTATGPGGTTAAASGRGERARPSPRCRRPRGARYRSRGPGSRELAASGGLGRRLCARHLAPLDARLRVAPRVLDPPARPRAASASRAPSSAFRAARR